MIATARRATAIGVLAWVLAGPALAQVEQSEQHDFRLETVVEGLAHPWAVAFLPDGGMLITERPGRLRLVEEGRLIDAPISGTPEVWHSGQGGLLDVALHPDFADNRLVYLSYSKPGERGATTALARGRLDGRALAEVEDIFVAEAWGSGGHHFGSRIVFDGDGHLFLSIGERGEQSPAQDNRNHKGTIVRLNDDGSVPDDNPFNDGGIALPEIWSYGHRNPQGLARNPETVALWENEHGPRGGDEINLVRPGRNYGWPVITYGQAYIGGPIGEGITEMEGMEQPVLHWTPSIAPSGMMIYGGDKFPEWRGDVFSGALALRHLRRVEFEGAHPTGQEELLKDWGQRIRDVREGPDGYVYILTDSGNGVLARLVPAQ